MSDRTLRWCVRAVVALPFVVALVMLAGRHWAPVLDLAMTEFRVRDVGGAHTPLIGLPGRIGTFPNQGSHPGPLSFYLLAPVYRLFGSRAYGMLVGAAVVNVGAAWTALWIAGRRGGRRLFLGVAAFLAVALAWFGASVLTQPWNPYLPLVAFVVVLLATWAVLEGDHVMLIPLVLAGTLCAQTHVPYLALSVVLILVAIGSVALRWWRARSVERAEARSLAASVGVATALWLPVFVDQWRHDPGNITMLRTHFLDPPEPPQGLRVGITTVLRHFDLFHVAIRTLARSSDAPTVLVDLEGGSWVLGLLVLLSWTAAVVVAWRLAERRLLRLHAVVGVAILIAVMSLARVFGKVWYYLSLWAWIIALLAFAATLWTAVVAWERSGRRPVPVTRLAALVLVVATGAFVVDAGRVRPPEDRLSRTLAAVVGPTAQALRDGVGDADGVKGIYAVVWEDAYYFGSQGYGLINELERRGFDARAFETYRVPVTAHRVADPSEVTADVVLVTGVNVERWRQRDDVVEVAFAELRTDAELAEFGRLHDDAVARLQAAGLDDVAALVDTNLFSARLDPRLPPGVEPMLIRMLVLGEETAVFIAPAGVV